MTPSETFTRPENEPYQSRSPRSIAALLADLTEQIRTLFRLEVALFKAELTEKLYRLALGLTVVAIGAVLAFSGWLALLAAAVLALAIVVQPWLAALIVGIVALAVAGLLFFLGKRWLDAKSLVPRRSLGSLRQDEAWIGERLP
ncbi:MAG: phage holin family protein [Stellaceae bacterium]